MYQSSCWYRLLLLLTCFSFTLDVTTFPIETSLFCTLSCPADNVACNGGMVIFCMGLQEEAPGNEAGIRNAIHDSGPTVNHNFVSLAATTTSGRGSQMNRRTSWRQQCWRDPVACWALVPDQPKTLVMPFISAGKQSVLAVVRTRARLRSMCNCRFALSVFSVGKQGERLCYIC
jgi:hypothetical protein